MNRTCISLARLGLYTPVTSCEVIGTIQVNLNKVNIMSKLYVVSVIVEDINGATHQSHLITDNRELQFYSSTNDDTVLQVVWYDAPTDTTTVEFLEQLFGEPLPSNQTHYEVNGYTDFDVDFA